MMDQRIFQKVKAYIEKYQMIAPGDTVAAGVSGGADSVCLFLILNELAEKMDFRLIAVHVNHGIREEAGDDAAYVKKLCKEREVPFVLVEEDVRSYARKEKLSEEEAGRKIRYLAFEDALKRYMGENGRNRGKIAVAHNANDRAETMLFHLFRGTGLTGASGIKPVRDNVIRPVLCLERSEIENYLKEKKISFCIDHTNLEDTYTRNRIRSHILPFAEEEICRGAVSHMCETADMLLETELYIQRQTQISYAKCVVCEEPRKLVLDAAALKGEEVFIQRQIILKALGSLTAGRKDITSVHIKQIIKLLCKPGSKRLSLPYGLIVEKEYEKLIMSSLNDERKADHLRDISVQDILEPKVPVTIQVPGTGMVEFTLFTRENNGKNQFIPEKTYTKWFDYDRITKSLMFRVRQTGDYLTIDKNLSRKSLKDYMIGEKIPKNQRENLYVLADGHHIVWVPGYRISEYYKISKDTERILQVQLGGGL